MWGKSVRAGVPHHPETECRHTGGGAEAESRNEKRG